MDKLPTTEAPRPRDFFADLVPGLIPTEADDDPSDISPYSVCAENFDTTPLWTLLLAGLFKAGGVYPAWAKAAGIAAALGTAWLARRLALAWTGDAALGLTAALVTAWSAPMVWGALSGMEVALAALLVTAAVIAHGRGPAGTYDAL